MSFLGLEGKVAIVTGGGAGIGRATALGFAREGAKVAVVDLSETNGQAVVAEIEKLEKGQAIYIKADVSRTADAQRIAEETVAAFGRIDILHNNAAIQTYGTVVSTDEDTWDRTININLKSIYLVSKYVIPHMIKGGGGAIVNTASIQAEVCLPNSAAYVASKGGVVALTREMALDFVGQNIRVNAVLPASVHTPMLEFAATQEAQPDKAITDWGKLHPMGRVGKPEEVANLVLFLASPAAGFITGAPYLVDGGAAAKIF